MLEISITNPTPKCGSLQGCGKKEEEEEDTSSYATIDTL